MKLSLLIFFLTLSLALHAQTIRVLGENTEYTGSNEPTKDFYYVHAGYDWDEKTEIATLSAYTLNTRKDNLSTMFYAFWEKANEMGANVFSNTIYEQMGDTTEIYIRIGRLSETELDANYDLYKRNMVYVIGNLNKNKQPRTVKFNKQKVKLKPMEFIAYQNKIGQDAILSVGGIAGAKAWIKGKKNRKPKFLSIVNYGIGLGMNGTPGVAVNTGRIYSLERSLGYFLLNILEEKE